MRREELRHKKKFARIGTRKARAKIALGLEKKINARVKENVQTMHKKEKKPRKDHT